MNVINKAECKRRFSTIGKEFSFDWIYKDDKRLNQYRQIVKVQSNAIAMAKQKENIKLAFDNPHKNATWLYFDQKDGANWIALENGGVEIQHKDGLTMVYTPL